MTLKVLKNGIRILHADGGMVLTNGFTYSTKVYLGIQADPNDWLEMIKEEAIEYIRQKEEEKWGVRP